MVRAVSNVTNLSLNINHVANKIVELDYLIEQTDPDIVFIQESHLRRQDKTVWIPNFVSFASHARDTIGANGLLTFVRKSITHLVSIVAQDDFYIHVRLQRDSDSFINLINFYRPVKGPLRITALNFFKNCLRDSNDTLIVGDWNTEITDIQRIISEKNNVWRTSTNLSGGSRVSNGIESSSIIDFSATNVPSFIVSEAFQRSK